MRKLALAALLLASASARAESPLWGSFQLKVASYRPDIDAEFGGAATPYGDIFGTGRGWMLQLGVARSLLTGVGTLDLGVGAGWFSRTGKGLVAAGFPNAGSPSGDDTSLRILPLSLSLGYRFDLFASTVPLAPYARVSLERWQWWVTRGGGGTARQGATNGWGAAVGVCLLLDFFDRTLAREMDRDMGINHTHLFMEAARAKVNYFGSKTSWDLSDYRKVTWSGGILFVF